MRTSVFDKVVCGVDDSEAGLAAARVAGRVTAPGGLLKLVSIVDSATAVHGGYAATPILARLEDEAEQAMARARGLVEAESDVETELLSGRPLTVLASVLKRDAATLVVVGRHGRSRAAGIALGSVATQLLHDAPCSVLVTPPLEEMGSWPGALVAGDDGSSGAAAAVAAATELGSRLPAPVRVLQAAADAAVEELVAAASADDLLVVGSRGLHGVKALGSVSERAAHRASGAVLVVR